MSENLVRLPTDYPLAHTTATKMLAAGLERAANVTGATQRDVAKQLNYKTSVVLSHMASGRVPIPIDRAVEIAEVLHLDPRAFLLAILKQRHPDVDFEQLLGITTPPPSNLAADLEATAGCALDELPNATKAILREVVGAREPERRWLTMAELPLMETLRREWSALPTAGLPTELRQQLAQCLAAAAASVDQS